MNVVALLRRKREARAAMCVREAISVLALTLQAVMQRA